MSKKRVVIHPGFHKSGTTALQEVFFKHRKLMKEHGVLYPYIGTKTHHRAAWSISGRVWGWEKRGGAKTSPRIWEDLVKRIASAKEEVVVLSSEFFSELDGEKIRKLRHDLRNHEVKILFTLRPLVKVLPSSYQQYLKYGMKLEYEEWLNEMFHNRANTKASPSFWRRHEHSKVIARWVDTFGTNNVTLLIADETKPEFLFNSVNDYLNLPKGTFAAAEIGSNRSLNMEEIALLLELNRQFPKERSWDEYEVFIRDGYIRQLTDAVTPAQDKARLLTPEWAVVEANRVGLETSNEINKLGVKVLGNLEALGNSIVATGKAHYPETIDVKMVAAAMLAFDEKRINKFPSSWLLASLRFRIKNQIKRRARRFN